MITSAFTIRHVVAMKCRRYFLFVRCVFQQITGELFDGKFVERHVAIERVDDPIAIGPDVQPQRIGTVTGRIGVSRDIQPHARPF